MSEASSIRWHDIIKGAETKDGLAFLELYREYARALHEKSEAKKRSSYWPFPSE